MLVVKGAWEQSQGPCYKLVSDPCLCVALGRPDEGPSPIPQWERLLWRDSFRGVTVRWIGQQKHVYRLCKGVRLCGRMSLTLLQFAWMNCDDEANGGPRWGWGSAMGAHQRSGPPTLRPFSRPVAVANVAILRFPQQRPRKKSTFTPAGHHECFRKWSCKQSVTFWPVADTLEQQTKQPGYGIRHGC